MFRIERYDPALQDIYHLTPISQATEGLSNLGFVRINADLYPWVSKNNPKIQAGYQQYLEDVAEYNARGNSQEKAPEDPFVYRYLTRSPKLDELLTLPTEEIDPLELIYRQKKIVYPSLGMTRAFWPGIAWFRYETDDTPDFTKGIRSNATDHSVNIFLAYQLMTHPELSQRFANPLDLSELARTEGMEVDYRAVWEGFVNLTGEQNVQTLLDLNLISEDQLGGFYQGISEKQLQITKHLQKTASGKGGLEVVTPYPFLVSGRTHAWPRADYLPYIGAQLLSYFSELPYCIPQGGQFPHRDLITLAQHYYEFADQVLHEYLVKGLEGNLYLSEMPEITKRAKQLDPALAASAKDIGEQVNSLKPLFLQTFRTYQREPGLLNRRRTGELEPGNFPQYAKMREEIQAFGGRAPHNTLVRKARIATDKGTI